MSSLSEEGPSESDAAADEGEDAPNDAEDGDDLASRPQAHKRAEGHSAAAPAHA